MNKNAYERVTAVVKSWTLGTTSFKRNLEFRSMPAYKSIKRYEKVGECWVSRHHFLIH